jgi:large subunit ribosomal protein L19e
MLPQKRIAAGIFKCSPRKVAFNPEKIPEIKEAITKQDVKTLISDGLIRRVRSNYQSRSRARVRASQRSKGRQRGPGSRKGRASARLSGKSKWIARIRLQRVLLKELKVTKSISQSAYRDLYRKSKGGFFRSRRHMELYLTERGIKK